MLEELRHRLRKRAYFGNTKLTEKQFNWFCKEYCQDPKLAKNLLSQEGFLARCSRKNFFPCTITDNRPYK